MKKYYKVPQNKKCCLNCKYHNSCYREETLPPVEVADGNHCCIDFEVKEATK